MDDWSDLEKFFLKDGCDIMLQNITKLGLQNHF